MPDPFPIYPNATLRLLRDNKLSLGYGVHHLRTAAVPMLARASGYDWLFIDTEHGAFSVQEATQLCLAALPIGVTPIVRVCADALDEGTRALDNGAQGIVVPHVDTPAQAKRVAARTLVRLPRAIAPGRFLRQGDSQKGKHRTQYGKSPANPLHMYPPIPAETLSN